MSAITYYHHDTIEAAMRQYTPSANPDFDPRKIDDVRKEVRRIVQRLRELHSESIDVAECYLNDIPTDRLISDIRSEIDLLNEQLELLISDLDRRRI